MISTRDGGGEGRRVKGMLKRRERRRRGVRSTGMGEGREEGERDVEEKGEREEGGKKYERRREGEGGVESGICCMECVPGDMFVIGITKKGKCNKY